MKVSVVTISYNQREFLERALLSVLTQEGVELEYIVVDSGSNDGSREVIDLYRDQITHVIFERDSGPADGLNKGFALATGGIYCYLNSDDEFEPLALAHVVSFFSSHPHVDVVCGHAWIIDESGNRLRRVWSDPYNHKLVAYGASIQIQPSTFIRAEAFCRVGGFNVQNRISWDSELLLDLVLSGARLTVWDRFLSLYRVHRHSITGAALHRERAVKQFHIHFNRLMGRSWRPTDYFVGKLMFLIRQLRNPPAFFERLTRGKVHGRAKV